MKHLAIGPGAMAYFAFLGALAALRDSDQLQDLEEISGASAGGLLAFFYVVADGNIKAVLDYSVEIPIKDIMKFNIKIFMKHFGFVSHSKIKQIIIDIIRIYFSKEDLTFKELRELRPDAPDLYISAYCVDLCRTEYFSSTLSPDVSVVDVLCMTIAVPFLFASVLWNDRRFIDGGTLESTPAAVFIGKTSVKQLQFHWNMDIYDTRNLKSYMVCVLGITARMRHHHSFPTIRVNLDQFQVFDFGMSNEIKLKMFSHGYNSTKLLEMKS